MSATDVNILEYDTDESAKDNPRVIQIDDFKFERRDPYGMFHHLPDGRKKAAPLLDGAFTSVDEAQKAVMRHLAQ